MSDYPDEFELDPTGEDIDDYRRVAEWHWAQNTVAVRVAEYRLLAEQRRAAFQRWGFDLDDPDTQRQLWQGWIVTCQNLLDFTAAITDDTEFMAGVSYVLQFSMIQMLLITEPNTPHPSDMEVSG